MQRGDFQSFLQLLVGLNIAFYSFKELRAPALARMRESIQDSRTMINTGLDDIAAVRKASELPGSTIVRVPNDIDISNKLLRVMLDITQLDIDLAKAETFEWKTREKLLSRLAMIVALLSIGLLLAASLQSKAPLPWLLAVTLAVISMIPVFGLIWLNYDLLRRSLYEPSS